jgi:hypothetical protein
MAAFKSGFNLPAILGLHGGVHEVSRVAALLVLFDPEYEGITIFRKVGNSWPVDAVLHLRRRENSPVLKLLFFVPNELIYSFKYQL